MLLNVLVATAGGGQSRLGGVIQRGVAIFRQVIRGQCHQGPGAAGSEQSLARLPQNQLSHVVPQTIGGNVFAAVRQGTKGIVANYLARNQIHNLAAEMRRRYAVRLMSGSARFYTGLGNRLAIYSFVGISFGGMVHNQRQSGDAVDVVVEGLFKEEPEKKAAYISENLFAADEETELLVVRHPESNVTILNVEEVFEDDFEVIREDELCLSSLQEVEEAEVQELISLQTQQSVDLQNLFQKLCEDNAVLREIIHCQTIEDDHLRRELGSALKTVDAQQSELLTLQKTIQNQNELLQDVLSQLETVQMRPYALKGIEPNAGPSRTARNMEYADPHASGTVINSEIDMERLRAEGGRVRGLKIHRKKRMKRDEVY
jgi:hypothetical protein